MVIISVCYLPTAKTFGQKFAGALSSGVEKAAQRAQTGWAALWFGQYSVMFGQTPPRQWAGNEDVNIDISLEEITHFDGT